MKRKELKVLRVDVVGEKYSIFVVAEKWNSELKKKVIEIFRIERGKYYVSSS